MLVVIGEGNFQDYRAGVEKEVAVFIDIIVCIFVVSVNAGIKAVKTIFDALVAYGMLSVINSHADVISSLVNLVSEVSRQDLFKVAVTESEKANAPVIIQNRVTYKNVQVIVLH